ncbi:4301_t:CDS:2, partial [Ambispora leptoticha]
ENGGSKDKKGENTDIMVDKKLEECPNTETIERIQASFGKLLRISSLKGKSITENPITMSQVQLCKEKNGRTSYCNDSLILVDVFKDNSHIAILVDYDVLDGNPKKLIYHIRCVADFDFDHIIIIGKTEYEIIFLDYYGHIFQWENMS